MLANCNLWAEICSLKSNKYFDVKQRNAAEQGAGWPQSVSRNIPIFQGVATRNRTCQFRLLVFLIFAIARVPTRPNAFTNSIVCRAASIFKACKYHPRQASTISFAKAGMLEKVFYSLLILFSMFNLFGTMVLWSYDAQMTKYLKDIMAGKYQHYCKNYCHNLKATNSFQPCLGLLWLSWFAAISSNRWRLEPFPL